MLTLLPLGWRLLKYDPVLSRGYKKHVPHPFPYIKNLLTFGHWMLSILFVAEVCFGIFWHLRDASLYIFKMTVYNANFFWFVDTVKMSLNMVCGLFGRWDDHLFGTPVAAIRTSFGTLVSRNAALQIRNNKYFQLFILWYIDSKMQ